MVVYYCFLNITLLYWRLDITAVRRSCCIGQEAAQKKQAVLWKPPIFWAIWIASGQLTQLWYRWSIYICSMIYQIK